MDLVVFLRYLMGTKRYLACGPWRAKKGQSVILLSGRLAELLHLDDREKKTATTTTKTESS